MNTVLSKSTTMKLLIALTFIFCCCYLLVNAKVIVKLDKTPISTNIRYSTTLSTGKLTSDPAATKVGQHYVHKLTTANLIINIVADLCPHGMMPLAFGLAQGGGTGWLVALGLLVGFGIMSTYTMLSYAALSKATDTKSIGEIWKKLINHRTEWVVDLSTLALCFGCCVFYSAFIGDIFASLAIAIGLKGLLSERWFVLLLISAGILLPLCLLDDLSALQFSSFMGFIGIIYTVCFHSIRLWDKSYTPGSRLLSYVSTKMKPVFPAEGLQMTKISHGTLMLSNMLCVAFLAHYNSINYFQEFETSPTTQKYNMAVSIGFGISLLIFAAMMLTGYHLFGTAAQPLLLNNFPLTADPWANLARAATGLAIIFGYPLMFAGLKTSLFSLIDSFTSPQTVLPTLPWWNLLAHLNKPKEEKEVILPVQRIPRQVQVRAVTAVVVLITVIALQCSEDEVSLVLGIVGSVLGCFVAYILPGVLNIAHHKQQRAMGLENNKLEVALNYALVGVGLVFGALGVWATLKMETDKLRGGRH